MECPPDKILNPYTNRCVKKCPDPTQTRNSLFRCNPAKVPCLANQYRYKKTGRCRTIKKKRIATLKKSSSSSSSLYVTPLKKSSSSSHLKKSPSPLKKSSSSSHYVTPLKKSSSSSHYVTPLKKSSSSPLPDLIKYPYDDEKHVLVPNEKQITPTTEAIIRRTPPPKPERTFKSRISEFFFGKKKTPTPSPLDRFSLTNRIYSKSSHSSHSSQEGKIINDLLPEQKFDMFDEVKYKRDYDIFSQHFTGIEKLLRLYSWFSYVYGYNLKKEERGKIYKEYQETQNKREYLEKATDMPMHFEFLSTWYNHFDSSKNTEDFIEKILDKNPCYSNLYNKLYRKYVDEDWEDVYLYVSEPDDPDCAKLK